MKMLPLINRNRCEAKAACVEMCLNPVFEIRALSDTDKAGLSLSGKLKAWFHGGQQAYLANAEACNECRVCVFAGPEGAIYMDTVAD